ncbi:hypothetical protein ASPBRDRAFT_585460 [Aspergillus brasiliensis CBS 101740]|uniref:Uncharacterized protein n=1 Tax=Aspergillus brasiliensis (strain CBS 101740 / IMI 381727 / IBT 21946) TaxID=767769 RepID=A0A1L9UK69_ASPBC|nr:hypothetical protein ASPBRDRAFT_585460 [Aspergillus brasiliensis CBS 101740]
MLNVADEEHSQLSSASACFVSVEANNTIVSWLFFFFFPTLHRSEDLKDQSDSHHWINSFPPIWLDHRFIPWLDRAMMRSAGLQKTGLI